MKIDKEEIKKIADLACLNIYDDEIEYIKSLISNEIKKELLIKNNTKIKTKAICNISVKNLNNLNYPFYFSFKF